MRAWRNLRAAALRPGPRATVLFGENGQGKTNFIEALHFLTTFRSFRTSRLDETVLWGETGAHLEGDVRAGGLDRKIEVRIAGGRKKALLDGKPCRRDAGGLRGVAAVLFVPEDLLLPHAAPAQRRRFVDRATFAADRAYGGEAAAYERVLRSRNALLREGRVASALLETYDEELARTGARIVMRRRGLTGALAPRVEILFRAIHGEMAVGVRYRSHPSIDEAGVETEVRDVLLAGLRQRRAEDERRRFSGFGPHTDDLELTLAGRAAREHGSQGQLRSLVLALKLAELGHVEAAAGEPPLLLLDDVASELDDIRRARLFETIAALPGQTLITVTDRGQLPFLPERCDFEVRGGELGQERK